MAFFGLGIQSIGGGSSTLILIHQACIERGWMDEEEFVRTWALVQISPGINLVKLTMLIGNRLRGWPGLICAAGGLLLPSGSATALMTAGFTAIRGQPVIQAVMKGILPATIGLSLATLVQMGQPLFLRAVQEGPGRLGVSSLILASAALLLGVWSVSPVLVLLISGAVSVGLFAIVPARAPAAGHGKPGAP